METGRTSASHPSGSGPKPLALPAASMAPCAPRSKLKLPERVTNRMSRTVPSLRMRKLISAKLFWRAASRSQLRYTSVTMFRRYSGYGNCRPGVLIVATSVPVLGVSPSTGATGAAVLGGGSRLVSVGGGLGVGGAGALVGFGLGGGFTGAGFSSGGGVGTASRASRLFGAGAGAATSSTAYDGGPALAGFTWLKAKAAAAACTTSVPTTPAVVPGGRPRSARTITAILPPRPRAPHSGSRRPG